MTIQPDDPGAPDVRALLTEHLATMHAVTPRESVHALDVTHLRQPDITFWTAREAGVLLGCGALRVLTPEAGEVKSMRSVEAHRGRGVGRALLARIVDEARARGMVRLSLETGAMAYFDPARRLYRAAGFAPCPPFGDYTDDPNSVWMTLDLA